MDSHGSPLLHPARYCYVSSAYVVPAGRRRGVLRRLLEAVEQWCAAEGLGEIRLHNAADNPLARAFRDHAGRLHQAVAAVADRVVFIAAGLPLTLKEKK